MDYRQSLQVGLVLDGKYRIERVLGSGGFGITYQAFDLKLAAPVAIKEYFPSQFGVRDATYSVRPRTAGDREIFDRLLSSFLREARTLNQFEHPAIVRVLSVFEAYGTAYMVMKYENGPNLKAWLADLARLPSQSELDRLAAPLLDALELMHDAEFLHRDIAPDNIIVRADSSPVLLDFGASRRIMGEMTGTLTGVVKKGYSPQEQYATDSRSQGPWTDIYALGATLYRCISGEIPDEATERMLDDRVAPAVTLGAGTYRPGFLAGIDAAMVLRPRDRPQSIAAWRPMLLEGVSMAPGQPNSRSSAATAAPSRPVAVATPPRLIESDPSTTPDSPPTSPPLGEATSTPDTSPRRRRKLGLTMAAGAVVLVGTGAVLFQTNKIGLPLITAQSKVRVEEAVVPSKSEEEWRRAADEARRQHEEQIERVSREAARRAAEETRRQIEEEARQRAAEQSRRQTAESSRRRAEEEKRQRQLAEEIEARRKAEDAHRRAVQEAEQRAAEDARQREVAALALQRAVQEAEQRAAEEARQRKLAEEAEAARRTAEQVRKRQEQEIARLTREAADRASEETRRQIQEETRKRDAVTDTAEEKEKSQEKEPTRIAALPKLPRPAPAANAFDGSWRVTYTAISEACRSRQGNFRIEISEQRVLFKSARGTGSGRVSSSGAVRWSGPSRFGPRLVDWTGTLRSKSGSGGYATRGGKCYGRFTAVRE